MYALRRLVLTNVYQPIKCATSYDNIILYNSSNIRNINKITSSSFNYENKRFYCDEQPRVRKLPTLMEFPNIIWPSFFKSVKNWILATFIITPRIDNDFNIQTFIEGSRRAVQAISDAMSSGDMNTLKELVTEEAFRELRNSLSAFSLSQKEDLAIRDPDDIYLTFPYEIGLMFDDDSKRSVEITMVYHVFRGFRAYKEANQDTGISISSNPPYKDKLFVLNYRFLREYSPNGEDSGWTVNVVNHFKMEDLIEDK